MSGQVEPVGQLRGEELRALTGKLWWRTAMALGPLVAGIAAVLALPDSNPPTVFALALVAVALAGGIGTYLLADSRAKAAFIPAWALSRGWQKGTGDWRGEATPLLRDGDRRHARDHVCGPLTSSTEAVLCHYTYEVRRESTDSKGGTTTTWDDYDFTVVETDVDTPGIDRLTLHPRSFGDNRLFDRIDSAVTSNRVVELESSELERDFKLEVSDSASDVAVRLLFEPDFIVWCLDQVADEMMLEVEDGTLVVAIPKHSYDADQLDALVEKASTVEARLADVAAKESPA